MLIKVYCPQQEIHALEQELLNLSMKESEVAAYTSRYNYLANFCPGIIDSEYKKMERYICRLTPLVQGLVATF